MKKKASTGKLFFAGWCMRYQKGIHAGSIFLSFPGTGSEKAGPQKRLAPDIRLETTREGWLCLNKGAGSEGTGGGGH